MQGVGKFLCIQSTCLVALALERSVSGESRLNIDGIHLPKSNLPAGADGANRASQQYKRRILEEKSIRS